MLSLEQRIKEFVRRQGVAVVGVAGPGRMTGPPSLDPTYTMPGARSIVSLAWPMEVSAIYEFLSKKSPTPHNLDQLRGNQRIHRVGKNLADFIVSLGYRARVVPSNNTYRRSLDVFSTRPSFSHRFGAMVSGIGAQGWSGNILTQEYGAACYLGTVVTDAVLQSDPTLPPRYFLDNFCVKCKLCDQVCPAGMFEAEGEEYVLLNGELHPRGKRRSIDLCNTSCFGLHGLSRDKKWTSWGRHWIKDWVDQEPDWKNPRKIRRTLMSKGASTGDSAPRYETIRKLGSILWPEALEKEVPEAKDLPADARERNNILNGLIAKHLGITGLKDPNILTCGQCALVCGPNLKETADRYHTLIESGLVVPGPDGTMVNVATFAEAAALRKKYPLKISQEKKRRDARASAAIWHKYYFGIEPKSILQGWLYARQLKKAVREHPPLGPEPKR